MTTPAVPILVGGLFAWSIYRRVRRNIGRQPLKPIRIVISLVVLLLISLMLAFVSIPFHRMQMSLGGGAILGAALGFIGLRLTKFDTTNEGHFYTPNTQIGIALSLLLVGRMIYRFWLFHDAMAATASGQPQLFQSPLTGAILGLTMGYYIVYRIGLFVHLHDKKNAPAMSP